MANDPDDDLLSLDFTSWVPTPEPDPVPPPAPALALVPLSDAEPVAVAPPPPPPVKAKATAPAPIAPKAPPPKAKSPAPVSRYPVVQLPQALVAAAEMHAQGKDMEACKRLDSAIKSNEPFGDAALRVWQALFELLQSLGLQPAFDTLAMAYANRFELSPPTWSAPIEEDDQVVASTGGRAHVALAGSLSARVGDALKQMMKLAQTSPLVRLNLAKLTDVDNDGATLLMRGLVALKKAKKECLLGSPEHLAALINSKLEPGRAENEAMWHLLLELYQHAYNQDAFEETAVAYAVTFELSPPSFESLPQGRSAPPPAEMPVVIPSAHLSLRGQLIGAGASEFAELSACAATAPVDELEINALGLALIDAASVETLKPVLASLNEAGNYVRITGLSQLVATYLNSHGVSALAELRTRKV